MATPALKGAGALGKSRCTTPRDGNLTSCCRCLNSLGLSIKVDALRLRSIFGWIMHILAVKGYY